jgi:hypothetical protein
VPVWEFLSFLSLAQIDKFVCFLSQMTTLIGKLTKAALLSRAEASEEFRHGIVMCIRSVFQSLQACKSSSCSCKHVLPSPFSILKQDPGELYEGYAVEEDLTDEELTTVDYATPEVCPLGFLQSLDMAPAIGHLLSLLLQVCCTSTQSQFFLFYDLSFEYNGEL